MSRSSPVRRALTRACFMLQRLISALTIVLGIALALRSPRTAASDPDDDQRTKWPGVHSAFDVSRDTYSLLCQRLDAANDRLQALQNYAVTVTLAVPIIVTAIRDKPDFNSTWFLLAMGTFGIIVVAGTIGQTLGTITALSPKLLYEKWLSYSDWEFKKNFVYWAGEHFDSNRKLVSRKARLGAFLTLVFLGEIACLITWAVMQID